MSLDAARPLIYMRGRAAEIIFWVFLIRLFLFVFFSFWYILVYVLMFIL